MRSIGIVLLAAAVLSLSGCMGTLKVLSAVGKADQNNRQNQPAAPQPNYYPNYQAPAVYQPQLDNSGRQYICNTIGYVTTCHKTN
jgi:flagellar basal body-associated protein FliL